MEGDWIRFGHLYRGGFLQRDEFRCFAEETSRKMAESLGVESEGVGEPLNYMNPKGYTALGFVASGLTGDISHSLQLPVTFYDGFGHRDIRYRVTRSFRDRIYYEIYGINGIALLGDGQHLLLRIGKTGQLSTFHDSDNVYQINKDGESSLQKLVFGTVQPVLL